MDLITVTEFGKRIGTSQEYVSLAIRKGRIKKTGRKIDWDTESIAWKTNRDEAQVRIHKSDSDAPRGTYMDAKIDRERYTAALKKLELERETGRLVEREKIADLSFKIFRFIRDAILNIPDRVSAEIAAEIKKQSDIDVDHAALDRIVHAVFDRESRSAMNKISNGPAELLSE